MEVKGGWEKALMDHENAHPQAPIRKLDGSLVGRAYKPQVQSLGDEDLEEK